MPLKSGGKGIIENASLTYKSWSCQARSHRSEIPPRQQWQESSQFSQHSPLHPVLQTIMKPEISWTYQPVLLLRIWMIQKMKSPSHVFSKKRGKGKKYQIINMVCVRRNLQILMHDMEAKKRLEDFMKSIKMIKYKASCGISNKLKLVLILAAQKWTGRVKITLEYT